MSKLVLNVSSVLSFFDEDSSASRHSNAIKTMLGEEFMFALLIEYFQQSGGFAEVFNRKCTTGKRSGPRLDGWVKATKGDESEPTYYQVEVKLWSAHGIGSGARVLRPGDDLAAYRQQLWKTYWRNGRFIEQSLNKVLTPMAPPVENAKVRPLACLWSPVHPEGFEESFFDLDLDPSASFPKIFIFSASSFLRQMRDKEMPLELDLPELVERILCLSNIFECLDVSKNIQLDIECPLSRTG